jgi:hypothetical protein
MTARTLLAVTILIATMAIPVASQTLTVSVTGAGKVTGTGIDCPSDCSENLPNVSARIVVGRPSTPTSRTVTLTATPNLGSAFKGWTGGCAEASGPTCTVTVPERGATVSAAFGGAMIPTALATDTLAHLKILFIGSHPTAAAHIIAASPPGAHPVYDCVFNSQPTGCTYSSGFAGDWRLAVHGSATGFVGWGDACAGIERYCTVSISLGEEKTVSMKFAAVGVSATSTGPGKIIASPPDAFVSAGTVVTFLAEPNPGASFGGWSGACVGSVPVCAVTAGSDNIMVGAQFSDFSVGVAGSGSVRITWEAGAAAPSITLVAEPAPGNVFTGWLGPCTGTGTCVVAPSAKVTAIFRPEP